MNNLLSTTTHPSLLLSKPTNDLTISNTLCILRTVLFFGMRIFLLLLLMTNISMAQNNPTSQPTPQEEALHQQLRILRDNMQNALNNNKLDDLLQYVTEDVVFTTMNGDRIIGKANIPTYFDKMLGGPKPVVQSVKANFTVEALSHLYGGDTAIAFGHSQDHYILSNGDTWIVTPQWSATLVRQNEQWLIANFHYSVNMFDNPILSAQRKWLIIGACLIALLTLAIGFFLGRKYQ